ncbi:MAG: serine hydrolase domain-containing protein [Pseudomonadota bacterium]
MPNLTASEQRLIATFAQDNTFGHITAITQKGQKPVIEVLGSRDFLHPERLMEEGTIGGIGSITKPFTAATLVSLWDAELTARKEGKADENKLWFPQGMKTPLSHFMSGLEERFPDCAQLFGRIKQDEHYQNQDPNQNITLEHLLNHSHGLGARNDDKSWRMVQSTGDRPLTLPEIANITEKRPDEKFGKHLYGNFGSDLVAMIIEVVASAMNRDVNKKDISFDEAVHQYVLDPHGLNDTKTQSEAVALYANPAANVASGYVLANRDKDGNWTPTEANFNYKSNTVGGGGLKSSVSDLNKFASLYFDAQMFENDEVKKAVLDVESGVNVAMDGGKKYEKYHLGIMKYPNGEVGHSGNDFTSQANLVFNPKTGETFVGLWAVENINCVISQITFGGAYPQDAEILNNFAKQLNNVSSISGMDKKPGSAEFEQAVNEAINAAENKDEIMQALGKFQQLNEAISKKYPTSQDLVDNITGIIAEFSVPQANQEQKTKQITAGDLGDYKPVKPEKPLLMTVKIPDRDVKVLDPNNIPLKEILAFTQEGLAVAVEYYNQKYNQKDDPEHPPKHPPRGEIKQISLLPKREGDFNLDCEKAKEIQNNISKIKELAKDNGDLDKGQEDLLRFLDNELDVVEERMATCVVEGYLSELRSFAGLGNQKIILTTAATQEDGSVRLNHSNPFVLTDEKLILLRDDHSKWSRRIYDKIAGELGVKLVYQLPVKEKGEEGRTSMQGDESSCHFIACGVLKDLDVEDMKMVAGFEDGYQPLPKMLKYSQSERHLSNVLQDEKLRESTPVKADGRSVAKYVEDNKKPAVGDEGRVGHRSRIGDKARQFIGLLEKLETALEGAEQTTGKFAAQILAERRQQKLESGGKMIGGK